jgi:probable F420-dependent oxidoreductase
MTVTMSQSTDALAPVAEDMSAFIISGAVQAEKVDGEHETVSRTPAQGIDDGVEAERVGYRRVWISERIDVKWSDVILSGIAARTSRLEVCTGVIDPTTRHPWTAAAYGATMQACYGERFVMGLGRGEEPYLRGTGIEVASFRHMRDYIGILRALWAGERVSYRGPAGTYDDMAFAERYHGNPPPIWFGGFALPKGAELIAAACDGVILVPMLTPVAVAAAKTRLVDACLRVGRDPATVRVAALVVTAPDLDDFETRALTAARMVTYLQYPGYGEQLADQNGWDHRVIHDIRNHPKLKGLRDIADRTFQRHQLMDVAAVIPDELMHDCSAIGTVDDCVTNLQRFIDAGADEIVTYGSTPRQNARLVATWRARRPR